jgi:outer membrane protein assembly factor BamB
MTRYPDGGSLHKKRRPVRGPAILYFVVASLLLAACGTAGNNSNWPGMSVDGNEVYVAYGAGVVAVDIVQEEETWSYPSAPNRNVQFYAAPSVQDGRIVFGDYGASGGLLHPGVTVQIYAYGLDEGVEGSGIGCGDASDSTPECLWIQGPSRHEYINDRIVAPPLQVDDRVFVGTADNFVLALDANSGDSVWPQPFEAGHSIWGQPIHDDGVLYVGSLDRSVYALDAATGDEIWQSDVGGSVSDRAGDDSDLVYVGSFDRQVHALDKASGESRWTAPTEAAVWGAPTLADDTVYFVDLSGNVSAVGAATGESQWTAKLGEYTVAAPVASDGVVYIATAGNPDIAQDERRGLLVAFDAESGEELWRESLSAAAYTTPVIVDDAIVVALTGGGSLLEVFDKDDGSSRWSFLPAAPEA